MKAETLQEASGESRPILVMDKHPLIVATIADVLLRGGFAVTARRAR